jgi:hypothetical protein
VTDAVSGAARALLPFTLQAHLRAGIDPGGQLEIDRRPVGEADALRLERRGVGERHLEAVGDVGAALRRRGLAAVTESARAGAARAARAAAEQPFEQVAEVGLSAHAFEIAGGESARAAAGAAAEAVEAAASAEPAAERHRRVAVGVDLAAVELGALVLVGKQVVGPGHFEKRSAALGLSLLRSGCSSLASLR